MSAQSPMLDVTIGPDLSLDGCDLIFAPTDERGTPGALNTWVLGQLDLSVSLLSSIGDDLSHGYAIAPIDSSRRLAFVVTVGTVSSKKLLAGNLANVFVAGARELTGASVVWLPLMGTGAGEITPADSLAISLNEIERAYANGPLGWQSLRISFGRDVSRSASRRLVQRTREFFAKGSIPATVNGEPVASDRPASNDDQATEAAAVQRSYSDNLRTQIDAPSVEPLLQFPEIAKNIVDVVEETVHGGSSLRREPGTPDARRSEWLSVVDARMTVGIFAPWGAGKSTLINSLRDVFVNRGYPVFAVNPWKWDGKGDLHDHVRSSVIDQAKRQGKVRLLRFWLWLRTFWRSYHIHVTVGVLIAVLVVTFGRPLIALLDRQTTMRMGRDEFGTMFGTTFGEISGPEWWFAIGAGVLTVVTKVWGPSLAKRIETWLFGGVPDKLGADGLSIVYRDIATLILRNTHLSRPFVFFFDDLDRCSAGRVAAVLESVHSLTAAGCIVFLACDDEYVTAALNAHYEKVAKVYPNGKFGRDYLEKIVQIQFRLPLLKNEDIYELGLAKMAAASEDKDPGASQPGGPQSGSNDDAPPKLPDTRTETPTQGNDTVEEAQLQEIIGDLLGQAVEPLGLNVRQAKAISNTLKLYLRLKNCRMESEARQLAAFVFAERFDPMWLDGVYHGVKVGDSPIAAIPDLASRLATMIGTDRTAMLGMYRLLGRRPGPPPAPPAAAPAPHPAALAAQ